MDTETHSPLYPWTQTPYRIEVADTQNIAYTYAHLGI